MSAFGGKADMTQTNAIAKRGACLSIFIGFRW